MHIVAALVLIVILASCGAAYLLSLRKVVPSDVARQRANQQRALELHPTVRAKTEEDRRWEALRTQQQMAYERQQSDIARKQEEMELRRDELRLKAWQTQHLIAPETFVMDYEPANLIPLHSLKRIEGKDEKAEPLKIAYPQPTQDQLLATLKPNSLTVSPGIRAANGSFVVVSIVEVPHLKFIGESGFGKSCLAGSVLNQIIETNGPRICQIALLDLEHKTSRLFEDAQHVAQVRVGKRLVQCVATDPDEVAQHLGYLKLELDRRTHLSEQELSREPVLLMYVEEMLSLQFEVDPALLARMFADLTILSVRGRKYGMFLLSCMQVDYSTKELQISQKMYRFRAAAAIDTTAARAAGFMNTELVKANFQNGEPGQFVVEYPGFSDIVLAPQYDWKRLLAQKTGFVPGWGNVVDAVETEEVEAQQWPNNVTTMPQQNAVTTAWEARRAQVEELRNKNWGKVATIQKVWGVKAGTSKKYEEAEAEYHQMLAELEA